MLKMQSMSAMRTRINSHITTKPPLLSSKMTLRPIKSHLLCVSTPIVWWLVWEIFIPNILFIIIIVYKISDY